MQNLLSAREPRDTDGHVFPYDFGSVPRTRAADGDALDVLVLLDAPTAAGCLVTVKRIGRFAAVQVEGRKKIRNDRLLGAPQTPANAARFERLDDVGEARLREIEHFFAASAAYRKGKRR